MSFPVSVYFSNTGESVIRVQIADVNFDKYLAASSTEKVDLNVGITYNIKLTEGHILKNTKYELFRTNTYAYD